MRKVIPFLFALITFAAHAGPFDFTIKADIQYNGYPLEPWNIMQAETPRAIVELRNAGKKQNIPAGSSATITIGPSLTESAYITAVSSSTGTYSYVCQFATINTNASGWVYNVKLADGGSNVYWSGTGTVNIIESTAISSTNTVDTSVPFSLPAYTVTPPGNDGEVLTSDGLGGWGWEDIGAALTPTLQEVTDQGDSTTGAVRAATIQVTGGTGTQGEMTWNADEETINLVSDGAVIQIALEDLDHCQNDTGSTITNGTLVYLAGTDGNSGNIKIAPYLADGSILPGYLLGIATVDIPDGDVGKVTNRGKVRNIDTSAYPDGTVLYASWLTAGGFETNAPAQGVGQWLPVAAVINSHPSVGTLYVRVTAIDLNQWAQYDDFIDHTTNTLAGGAHGGETDPLSVLADGSRSMSGNLNMGGNDFTNAANVWVANSLGVFSVLFGNIAEMKDAAGDKLAGWVSGGNTGLQIYDGENGASTIVVYPNAATLDDAGQGGIWKSEGTATNGSEIVNYDTMTAYVAANTGSGGYRRAARSTAFSRTGADPETSAEADGNTWWTPDNAAAPESLDAYQLDLLPNETNVTVTAYWFADTTGTYQSVWYGGGTAQVTNTINITSTSATDPTVVSSSWSFTQSGGGRYPIYPSYTGGTAGDVIRTRFDVEVSR